MSTFVAYVTNPDRGAVTPIDSDTKVPGPDIPVPGQPWSIAIAITPNRATAYVTNLDDGIGSVTPIDLANNMSGTPIAVGDSTDAIAISPDGATAYVITTGTSNDGVGSVIPIDLATNTPGPPILGPAAGGASALIVPTNAIAFAPNGVTAYVGTSSTLGGLGPAVTPIDVASQRPTPAIAVGVTATAIAISPDGTMAYVVDGSSDTVTPINLATNKVGDAIPVGRRPRAIAITPTGSRAYVTNFDSNSVTPIDLPANTTHKEISLGFAPLAIAIASDGATAYVTGFETDSMTPIDLGTNSPGTLIPLPGNKALSGIAIRRLPDRPPSCDEQNAQICAVEEHIFELTQVAKQSGGGNAELRKRIATLTRLVARLRKEAKNQGCPDPEC